MNKSKEPEVEKISPVYHERFKDAMWYDKPLAITIGGAGGIGSWLTLFLSRVGHEIYLYDHDRVETVNLAGQVYGPSHVGMTKTGAMQAVVTLLCAEAKVNEMGKFGEGGSTLLTNITFMAFDNMVARKLMAQTWNQMQEKRIEKAKVEGLYDSPDYVPPISILIDGRMEAESGMVFVIKSPSDYERYMKEDMFEDSEVPDGPCSYKATSHNGARLAAEMMNVLNNHISNKYRKLKYRTVPYKVEYAFPTLDYEITK